MVDSSNAYHGNEHPLNLEAWQNRVEEAVGEELTLQQEAFSNAIFQAISDSQPTQGTNAIGEDELNQIMALLGGLDPDAIRDKFDEFNPDHTSLRGEEFRDFMNFLLEGTGIELNEDQAAALQEVFDTNSYTGVNKSEFAAAFGRPEDARSDGSTHEAINRDEFVSWVSGNLDINGFTSGFTVEDWDEMEEGLRFLFNSYNTNGGGALTHGEWSDPEGTGETQFQTAADFMQQVADDIANSGDDWGRFDDADRTGEDGTYDGQLNEYEFKNYLAERTGLSYEEISADSGSSELFNSLDDDGLGTLTRDELEGSEDTIAAAVAEIQARIDKTDESVT